MEKKVTIKTIAKKAGVSTCLVSRALGGKSGVSDANRKKIKEVAEQLGYVPNTIAAMLYKQRTSKQVVYPLIAFIQVRKYERGYLLELIETYQRKLGFDFMQVEKMDDPKELARVLYAKGVQGIIVGRIDNCDEHYFHTLSEKFSTVLTFQDKSTVHYDRVNQNAFEFIHMTLDKVLSKGYQRLGVVIHNTVSEEDDRSRIAAACYFKDYDPRVADLQFLHFDRIKDLKTEAGMEKFRAWEEEYQPDVIIFDHHHFYGQFFYAGEEHFFKRPMASVSLNIGNDKNNPLPLAGCDNQIEQIIEASIRRVLDLITLGQKGTSAFPHQINYSPKWRDGKTLPTKTPS